MQKPRTIRPLKRSKQMANSGLSFPLDKLTPEILNELNLPPLPGR